MAKRKLSPTSSQEESSLKRPKQNDEEHEECCALPEPNALALQDPEVGEEAQERGMSEGQSSAIELIPEVYLVACETLVPTYDFHTCVETRIFFKAKAADKAGTSEVQLMD